MVFLAALLIAEAVLLKLHFSKSYKLVAVFLTLIYPVCPSGCVNGLRQITQVTFLSRHSNAKVTKEIELLLILGTEFK